MSNFKPSAADIEAAEKYAQLENVSESYSDGCVITDAFLAGIVHTKSDGINWKSEHRLLTIKHAQEIQRVADILNSMTFKLIMSNETCDHAAEPCLRCGDRTYSVKESEKWLEERAKG